MSALVGILKGSSSASVETSRWERHPTGGFAEVRGSFEFLMANRQFLSGGFRTRGEVEFAEPQAVAYEPSGE